jgi:P-type Cu2+ transporter
MNAVAHASWTAGHSSHAIFAVEGMRCAACSRSIERAVAGLAGIDKVSVNAATGRAAVDWNPDTITLNRILAAVTQTGFKPVPLSGEGAANEQRAERRLALKRIGLAGLGMMQTMMFVYCIYAAGAHGIDPGIEQYLKLAGLLIATPVLVYSGAPFFKGALRDLRRRTLGMDVPVALALVLAFGASVLNTLRGTGEIYFDSVTMFIFFLLAGRFIEMTVRQRNLSATDALARSLPTSVTRIKPDGTTERIAPAKVNIGDTLMVPKGAVVAVDGLLMDGEATVDESLLTGEATPIDKHESQALSGGSINIGNPIRIVAMQSAAESTLANIVRLLERTQAERPDTVRTADRVASWFVLVTLLLAACAAFGWLLVDPPRALPAALAVLVVTCPCALSLATPAALAAATTRIARLGLLVTRSDALERLARVDTVVVDKTGTLTRGTPTVRALDVRQGYEEAEVLAIAAALERCSNHPIATAFRAYDSGQIAVSAGQERAGQGVGGRIDDESWWLGNSPLTLSNATGTVATFTVTDALRDDAGTAIQQLRELGLQVVIASGDHEDVVSAVARQLGIAEALGRLTPSEKLSYVERRQTAGARVLMIGDGINDGPVLAAASVSCAMAQGSAVAQAAADLLLLNDSLTPVAEAIRTARRMRTVIRQNLGWALVYNLSAVPLAALGLMAPWVAALGMSGSSLLVALNAARLAGRTVK